MDTSNLDDLNAIVGPGGLEVEETDPKPLLENVGDYNYVEILNPLSVTFKDQVALTTNITAPMPIGKTHENAPGTTKNEADIRQIYGFDLRAQAQQSGKTHIITRISLASGETKRFLGGEAHVIVRHLVSAILQREGKTSLLANAHERRRVEEQVVQHVGNLQDAMGRAPLSVREQLKTTLEKLEDNPGSQLNQGETHEQEFPELSNGAPAGVSKSVVEGGGGQGDSAAPKQRGRGRTKA